MFDDAYNAYRTFLALLTVFGAHFALRLTASQHTIPDASVEQLLRNLDSSTNHLAHLLGDFSVVALLRPVGEAVVVP